MIWCTGRIPDLRKALLPPFGLQTSTYIFVLFNWKVNIIMKNDCCWTVILWRNHSFFLRPVTSASGRHVRLGTVSIKYFCRKWIGFWYNNVTLTSFHVLDRHCGKMHCAWATNWASCHFLVSGLYRRLWKQSKLLFHQCFCHNLPLISYCIYSSKCHSAL